MALPTLKGPDGRPVPPEKSFLVDANGNPLTPLVDDKDFALPTPWTLSAIISGAQKTYLANSFDEAMKHSQVNAMALYRDCRVMGWVEERRDSVVNLKWSLQVDDDKDPIQKCVRDGLTISMKRIPHFKQILKNLLKGALWRGRGCTEFCWRWQQMNLPTLPEVTLFPGMNGHANGDGASAPSPYDDGSEDRSPMEKRWAMMPYKHRPVNGDKINYLWGESPKGAPPGSPMVKVHGGADVPDAEIVFDNIGPNVVLTKEWRERFIIHTYDPDDADYFSPEMAGGIHGVGIRSRIYWLNWIRMEYAAWIQDLFDRLGLGFLCVKYDQSSARARTEAENLGKKWNRRSIVSIPVSPDQLQKGGGIEVVEVPTTGVIVVQELIKYCDKFIERYILRQTLSGGGVSEGDGARGTKGPAEMAKNTELGRIMSDAEELAETITGSEEEPGIVSIMHKWTYPGTYGKFPVYFRFEIEDDSPKEKLQSVVMASGLDVNFKKDEVRALTGMSKPGLGDETCGGRNQITSFGEDAGGQKPGDGEDDSKSGDGSGKDNQAGNMSSSREAAQRWISVGKQPGQLNSLAQEFGITRQAIGQAAKILEGGG